MGCGLWHAYRYRQDPTFGNRLARRCMHCHKLQYQSTGFLYGVRWITIPRVSVSPSHQDWYSLGEDLDPPTVWDRRRQHAWYRASAWGRTRWRDVWLLRG